MSKGVTMLAIFPIPLEIDKVTATGSRCSLLLLLNNVDYDPQNLSILVK